MMYFVIAIMVLANDVFWLIPGGKIAGIFKPNDIGLVFLFVSVIWSLSKPQVLNRSRDPIAIAFLFLILMLTLQASMASFNFGQSILNGLVAVRDQFYYLSFFVFLAVLNSEEKMKRFLDICSILAIILGIISIIDHLFGGIYQHQFADSQTIRSGIVRGQVAGMDLITLALLWQTAKLTAKKSAGYSAAKFGLAAAFFMGMHFFRQTRSRLVAVMMVLGWLLYKSKQKMLLFSGIAAIVFAALIAEVALDENIILSPFTSTVEVAQDYEGEVPGRVEQIMKDFEVFLEDPILGSGSAALRASEAKNSFEASEIARKADLGYSHWLKAYGLLGAFWLIWFYFLLWKRLKRNLKRADTDKSPIPIFMLSYFYFVVVSFVTLNHFMFGFRIILISALAAMAVNLGYLYSQKSRSE